MQSCQRFLFLCTTLFASNATHAVAPAFKTPTTFPSAWHHHIQNFNVLNPDIAHSYVGLLDHALAMSYSSTSTFLNTNYVADYPPIGINLPSATAYEQLKRTLNLNAEDAPVGLFFNRNSSTGITSTFGNYDFSFTSGVVSNYQYMSNIDPTKEAGHNFPIDDTVVANLKRYVCAIEPAAGQVPAYKNINKSSTYADFINAFYSEWKFDPATSTDGSGLIHPVANFQNKAVVNELAAKAIAAISPIPTISNPSISTPWYDNVFFDVLSATPMPELNPTSTTPTLANCANKDLSNDGMFYATWKEGQREYVKQITAAARARLGRAGTKMMVFANLWSPNLTGRQLAEPIGNPASWYYTNQLRLDHYYFESGGFGGQDAMGLKATGSIPTNFPNAGLPAYIHTKLNSSNIPVVDGYIPASLVSVETHYYDPGVRQRPDFEQHFNAAVIAATQGSWFGWYGGSNVEETINTTNQVIKNTFLDATNGIGPSYSNAMQLLRAIPNWENMAGVALVDRIYDPIRGEYHTNKTYNSVFNRSLIQSWNPVNKTLYVVFRSLTFVDPSTNITEISKINLRGGTIDKAWFVDAFFNPTTESAIPCLANIASGTPNLTCNLKLNQGIRITFK